MICFKRFAENSSSSETRNFTEDCVNKPGILSLCYLRVVIQFAIDERMENTRMCTKNDQNKYSALPNKGLWKLSTQSLTLFY